MILLEQSATLARLYAQAYDAPMDVRSAIEHTLLTPSATRAAIDQLCGEAIEHGFAGVCVNPCHVLRCARLLAGEAPHVVTVVGFPLGSGSAASDVAETASCVALGAEEIDVVIPIGAALEGLYALVTERVGQVVAAAERRPVKVILEAGYFDDEALEQVARAALDGGAHYLKTSTGFGPSGASVEHVALLRRVTRGAARVKASGGIRDYQTACAMLEAGAHRLGTSSGVAIVAGLDAGAPAHSGERY